MRSRKVTLQYGKNLGVSLCKDVNCKCFSLFTGTSTTYLNLIFKRNLKFFVVVNQEHHNYADFPRIMEKIELCFVNIYHNL